MYPNSVLIKEALHKHGYAVLPYRGTSMYPTLKEGMKIKIAAVSPTSLKSSDIVVYVQENMIVAHRLIRILSYENTKLFVTKGDHQPFGGISYVKESDLLGRLVLTRNRFSDFFHLFMGRAFLVYEKNRLFFPERVKIILKYFIRSLYKKYDYAYCRKTGS